MLCIRSQIGFLSFLEVHGILLLLRRLLVLHLHLVQLIHALGCIFYLIEEPHLLKTVSLIRSVHHVQRPLWLQYHSPLFWAIHLIRSILNLRCIIHVAYLGGNILSILGVSKLRNNLIRIHAQLLHKRGFLTPMILLRVVNQFALWSVLRPDQHIVLQEPVGGLPALFLVEGGLGSAELFQFVLALLYQPLIILQ